MGRAAFHSSGLPIRPSGFQFLHSQSGGCPGHAFYLGAEWWRVSHTLLKELGFQNLIPYTQTDRRLNMILLGRAELLYLSDMTAYYQMRQDDISPRDVKPAYKIRESELYLVFSLKTDPELVAHWQQAYEAIKDRGDWQRIVGRYLPPGDIWRIAEGES